METIQEEVTPTEQAVDIQEAVEPEPDPTRKKPGGRTKYRLPGNLWRAEEIWPLLNEQLNLGYDLTTRRGRERCRNWFQYLIRIGIVPRGQERTPINKRTQSGGMRQVWTDEQVRHILATVPQAIIPPPGEDGGE